MPRGRGDGRGVSAPTLGSCRRIQGGGVLKVIFGFVGNHGAVPLGALHVCWALCSKDLVLILK